MVEKKFATVLGRQMAYVDDGEGDPIVFLHGNPTSSYLWRNVIPEVRHLGRCIAPDLIGMGDSDKLPDSGPDSYRLVEHRRYLDALLEQLAISKNVILVIHDWGSALGFDWARRHPEMVKGIVYMEALVGPLSSWDQWPESARSIFQGFRSEAGETLILEKNYFIERVLPASVLDPLTEEDIAEYRRPYLEPGESRRPTLSWPRQLPIGGEPSDVTQIVSDYQDWLKTCEVPKLFIEADPGFFSSGIARATARWPRQETVKVRGHHFLQEDSGPEIGQAIAAWLAR